MFIIIEMLSGPGFSKDEDFLHFIVIWDHWQPSLKQIVCSARPSFEKQYLWDDSSDEDVMNM